MFSIKHHTAIILSLACLSLSACGTSNEKKADKNSIDAIVNAAITESAKEKNVATEELKADVSAADQTPRPDTSREPAPSQPDEPSGTALPQPEPERAPATPVPATTIKPTASRAELKQRLDYAKQVLGSSLSTRIHNSSNAEAIALLGDARKGATDAQRAYDAGEYETAHALILDALSKMNKASRMVPSESVLAGQKQQYQNHRDELTRAIDNHRISLEKVIAQYGADAVVKYDEAEVARLEKEAATLAARQQFQDATNRLELAQKLVNMAVQKMFHAKTVIYKLDIDTPEKEYAYEEQRYMGYDELIPVGIEMRKPTPEQIALINRMVGNGHEKAAQARITAEAGDYPKAIRMIMDATEEIRKALRVMGINQ
ncbi:MAG: hypothetical protein A2V90_04200 [Gammaproteobacteria bacterium RBG_16_57_12]|nr:MAG: hypothetical protein A2V90_04200 [Gammaproteobacteria bacterium RBG_16_57_12]